LVTQFIEPNCVSEETVIAALYKKEQNNLLDYHQRVPTQIDRFILLKSALLCDLHHFGRGGYFSDLKFSVNHFFQTFFQAICLAK
ncbi:hypothetical protein AB4520_18030, partial [Vibrio renipiscarius]|uniref:hypothetical protein n=1 Tax=Vibrio renipiscarius TaxID=1461322 RepID=UPI00354D2DF8